MAAGQLILRVAARVAKAGTAKSHGCNNQEFGSDPGNRTIPTQGRSMTKLSEANVEIFGDPDSLARRVAEWILELALAKRGPFTVALSGGTTPQRLYQTLAGASLREQFPWSRVHWFWGDERFVPHKDALSNYRMACEALLAVAPVPAGNIHPVPTWETTPDAAAMAYERELMSCYGAGHLDPDRPLFDLVLLGLGTDGHTASLFPGSEVLNEKVRWVAAVVGAKPEARITLTYPALESCRQAAFLIAGRDKQAALSQIRRGQEELPAARLNTTGALRIFADAAAVDVADT